METIRAFIAVDIGDEIREKLDALQRKLKKMHANVRWVKPRNIHLTLVFLGDVPPEQMDPVRKALADACTGLPAFDLEAAGTGFFGKSSHPRVLWAGIADCPPLADLQHRIVRRLGEADVGFDTKPFSPHLTLGRVKGLDRHTGPLLEQIGKYKQTAHGSTRIDRVELIQSVLAPRGAEYAVLHRVTLD